MEKRLNLFHGAMCTVPGCDRNGELRDPRFGRLCHKHGAKVRQRTKAGWPDPYEDIERDGLKPRMGATLSCGVHGCNRPAHAKDERFGQICHMHYDRRYRRLRRGTDPYRDMELFGNPKATLIHTCTNCEIEFERETKASKRNGRFYDHHFCGRKCFLDWLRKNSHKWNDRKGMPSATHHSARLTIKQVEAIRREAALNPHRGLLTEQAKKYGVTKQAIRSIVKGRTYKSVGLFAVTLCPKCAVPTSKFGYTRLGIQRFRCKSCKLTFSSTAHDSKAVSSEMGYPFIRQSQTPDDLVAVVNNAVPRTLPDDARAEICQNMLLAIMDGTLLIESVEARVGEYIKAYNRSLPSKWDTISLDYPSGNNGDDRPLKEQI